MYNKVEISGVNTSKLKTISEARKKELLKLAKAGDKKAREEMINSNLKLVLSVMQSFTNRGENPDDLFQVGCIGLIKAVDNFDAERFDVRFSTYAVPMIIGELRRYLRDYNIVRVSRSLRDLAYKSLQAREKLSAALAREPTTEEIAKEIGCKREDIACALGAITEPISFYEPVYSEGNGDPVYLLDQISDNVNLAENWINDIAISEAIKKLGEREKRILALRFFKGRTQTEVAAEIGISQAQVSRLEKNAVEKIRNQIS